MKEKITEEIEKEVEALREQTMPSLKDLRELIYNVRENVDHIYAPLFVTQGSLDTLLILNRQLLFMNNANR